MNTGLLFAWLMIISFGLAGLFAWLGHERNAVLAGGVILVIVLVEAWLDVRSRRQNGI